MNQQDNYYPRYSHSGHILTKSTTYNVLVTEEKPGEFIISVFQPIEDIFSKRDDYKYYRGHAKKENGNISFHYSEGFPNEIKATIEDVMQNE